VPSRNVELLLEGTTPPHEEKDVPFVVSTIAEGREREIRRNPFLAVDRFAVPSLVRTIAPTRPRNFVTGVAVGIDPKVVGMARHVVELEVDVEMKRVSGETLVEREAGTDVDVALFSCSRMIGIDQVF
jgi:hypothetical protein